MNLTRIARIGITGFNTMGVPGLHTLKLIERSRDFPALLHVDLTNHCNKNCSFCCLHDRYKTKTIPLGHMDFELYKSIVDQGNEYHGKEMILDLSDYGESLLYPKLYEAIRYARDYEMEIRLVTNGLLLYEKRKALIDGDIDNILISMFDDSAVEATKKFLEYRGKKDRPRVRIKYFTNLKWRPPKGLNPDDWIVNHIRHWLAKDNKRESAYNCYKLLCNPSVTWDGYFCACCIDCHRESSVGNVERDSIDKLWRIMAYLYHMQQKGYFFPPCDRCTRFEDTYNRQKGEEDGKATCC